jgi:hypothetical protein
VIRLRTVIDAERQWHASTMADTGALVSRCFARTPDRCRISGLRILQTYPERVEL